MNNNLGLYQDLVVAAKAAGGVAEHIATIERAAVSKAAPAIAARSYSAGATTGAAVTAVTAVVVMSAVAGTKFLAQRRADQVAAEEAKKRLISEFANDGSQSGEPPTSPATA